MNARAPLASVLLAVALAAPCLGGAAQPKATVCTVVLANGDQMAGSLAGVADRYLHFAPSIAPDTTIKVDLKRVDRIVFGDMPKTAKEPKGHLLTLRDGSVLYGKFTYKLTPDALHFALEGMDPVAFPRAAVEELVLSRTTQAPDAPRDPKAHVVVLTSGAVLLGNVQQGQDNTLVVSGGAVQARLYPASVASITFPDAPPRKPPDDGKERLLAVCTTRNGARINGAEPRIEGGEAHVTLAGGHHISLPLEQLIEISFTTEGGAIRQRAVLAWGAYGDRNEEFPRTVGILKEALGTTWRITENFSPEFNADFRRELARSGVLLIPELEQWSSSSSKPQLAAQLKPIADSFLRRGGNVIVCGITGSHIAFLTQSGLMNVRQVSSSSSSDSPFTREGRRIAQGIGDSFRTTNATQFYSIDASTKAIALAGTNASTPVVARRVGRGWVILLGMDYYESNDQTKKLLVNAATFR